MSNVGPLGADVESTLAMRVAMARCAMRREPLR